MDVRAGGVTEPALLLAIGKGELTYPGPDQLRDTPAWAKPIVAAAYKYFGLMP